LEKNHIKKTIRRPVPKPYSTNNVNIQLKERNKMDDEKQIKEVEEINISPIRKRDRRKTYEESTKSLMPLLECLVQDQTNEDALNNPNKDKELSPKIHSLISKEKQIDIMIGRCLNFH